MTHEPLVTAIVLNYNGAHLLPDALNTLKRQQWSALEVVVVDNGSLDDSAAVATGYGVRWLPLGTNLGFSQANNRAAREAKGEFLFFVNNDMRFTPDCVGTLAQVLRDDPSLFAADPTQLDWEGTRVIHGRTFFIPGSFQDTVVPPFAVHYTGLADSQVEVPWGCAGSLLVRRDRFEVLGGFDPTFFIDFEDTDLCWRAWLRGWRTVYVPSALLYHKVGMSGDEYQHLIRGVQPGQVPRFWFRRRVSYHANLLRFALKCLPMMTSLRVMEHLMGRMVWHLTRRNFKIVLAVITAFGRNIRQLPSTWVARREVRRTQQLDHGTLLQRFTPSEEKP
jgi:GT2 family glycosyltransferase